jgi:site-specific DNA-methyltransferase (adenine-specific)
MSRLTKDEQSRWFRPIWSDVTGASTRQHPAPYPVELAYRLIRMFSFTGDTVLDPFAGTGTTSVAAIRTNRNSLANELDPEYYKMASKRLEQEVRQGVLGCQPPELYFQSSH